MGMGVRILKIEVPVKQYKTKKKWYDIQMKR